MVRPGSLLTVRFMACLAENHCQLQMYFNLLCHAQTWQVSDDDS